MNVLRSYRPLSMSHSLLEECCCSTFIYCTCSLLQAPAFPSWVTYRIFTIWYQAVGGYAQSQTYYNSSFINETGVQMSYILTSLTRDTVYRIKIRADVRNLACYYHFYTYGNYSDVLLFRTNATRKYEFRNSWCLGRLKVFACLFYSYHMQGDLLRFL